MKRRIVCLMIAVAMMISLCCSCGEPKENKIDAIADFDVWKAEYWINNIEGYDNSLFDNITGTQCFYQALSEGFLEDWWTANAYKIWSVIGVDEIASNPNYYYEIMILNYLYSESQICNFESQLADHTTKAAYELVKGLAEELGEDFDENLPKIITELPLEKTKELMKNIDFSKDLIDDITFYGDTITKTVDYLNALSSIYAIKSVEQSRIDYIKGLKNYAQDNKEFVKAIDEIVYLYETNVQNAWAKQTEQTLVDMTVWLAKESLDLLISVSPVAPYAAIIKGGIFVFDALFSTTEQTKQYFNMISLYTMDRYTVQYLIDLKNEFLKNKTVENAKKLNGILMKYIEFQIYGLNASKELLSVNMVDNVYAYLTQNHVDEYKEISSAIDSQIKTKKSYFELNALLAKTYSSINNLPSELFDYSSENGDIENIEFANKEINVSIIHSIVGEKVIVAPNRDVCPDLKFVSADSDIIEIKTSSQNIVYFMPKKIGTTTITATTPDGKLDATMTVNVVEKEKDQILGIPIDSNNFPDENFRQYISNNLDQIKDGYLSTDEIIVTTEMNVHNMGISNLDGIEYFQNLVSLTCSNNPIKTLNLSNFSKLKELYCDHCSISCLKLTENPNLKIVHCIFNNIQTVDVSGCTSLENLNCNVNDISDMSNIIGLEDLTKLNTLGLMDNKLTNIDKLTSLKKLLVISISGNEISDTDIQKFKRSNPYCIIN